MFQDENLMSFEQLRTKYDLSNSHFLKYLQGRSFITASRNQLLTPLPLFEMEQLISDNCHNKGHISVLYDMLVSNSSESRLKAWKEDIQEGISLEDWGVICVKAHGQTANTRLRLLQYNRLMCSHITPARLHQLNNNIPDICIKCEQAKGTPFHCMWDCKKIATFWCEISRIIHKMLDVKLPLEPKMFILGLYPATLVIYK